MLLTVYEKSKYSQAYTGLKETTNDIVCKFNHKGKVVTALLRKRDDKTYIIHYNHQHPIHSAIHGKTVIFVEINKIPMMQILNYTEENVAPVIPRRKKESIMR